MRACNSDDDCGGAYECLTFRTSDYAPGKVCTLACETDAECPGRRPEGVCGDPVCESGVCGFSACMEM